MVRNKSHQKYPRFYSFHPPYQIVFIPSSILVPFGFFMVTFSLPLKPKFQVQQLVILSETKGFWSTTSH